jgi:hypothetical protein
VLVDLRVELDELLAVLVELAVIAEKPPAITFVRSASATQNTSISLMPSL